MKSIDAETPASAFNERSMNGSGWGTQGAVWLMGLVVACASAWWLWPAAAQEPILTRETDPRAPWFDIGVDADARDTPRVSRSAARSEPMAHAAGLAPESSAMGPIAGAGAVAFHPASDPAGLDRGTAVGLAVEEAMNRRQRRFDDLISDQIAKFAQAQQLTPAQQDELFVIMTATSDAIREGLRQALQSSAQPSATTIQPLFASEYARADQQVRALLTDAQYGAYKARRVGGALMGTSDIAAPSAPRP